jgi:hypothetical protein
MPKKAAGRKQQTSRARLSKGSSVALCLALLFSAGAVFALWAPERLSTPTVPTPAGPPAAAPAPAPLQAQNSFSPSSPSKEYIYAGGRLVATEEPATRQNQSISFNQPPDRTYGDPAFQLSATASSGLPVSFVVTAGPAALSGSTLTITGAGAVTVRAEQEGNTGYNAAEPITRSFTVAKATANVALSNLAQVYDGSAKAASVTTNPPGLSVSLTYDGSATPPTNAGGYAVAATVEDVNYTGSASGTLVIGKAQAVLTLSGLSHTYDGAPKQASVATSPAGLSGVDVTYNGLAAAPTAAGSYAVVAHLSNLNYEAASVSATLTINKATAVVTVGVPAGLVYDGSPKAAVVSTTPAGLAVSLTYSRDGSPVTAPTEAGSYHVTAMVADPNYEGGASGTLVIGKAQAALALASLSHTYDGTPRSAAVTTSPAGLSSVSVTYDGSATAPTNAGSYQVVASLSNSNYEAPTASGTLVITKGQATLTLGSLSHIYDGSAKSASVTTSPAGLGVISITYSGSATAPTNAGSYQVSATLSNSNVEAQPATGTLVIARATPQLTWANPADITYGTALGAAQLNASSASAGTFAYTPAAGAILNAGPGQTLSVTFTPTDAQNYNQATASAQLNVLKATPQITWANPSDIDYGTPLGSTQLNASASFNGAQMAGSFAYSPAAGTVLPVGSNRPLSASFTPADAQNFNSAAGGALVNVLAVTPHSLSLVGTSHLEVASGPAVNLNGFFTAEAWIKLNSSTGSYQSIMERFGAPGAAGVNGGFILRVMPDGRLEFYVLQSNQAGYPMEGDTVVTAGVWHHVAAVSDGQLDGTRAVVTNPAQGVSNLFIGKGAGGNYGNFNGLIDEARLTAAGLYTSNFTPELSFEAGPQTRGLWKFDGQKLNDFSGNGAQAVAQGNIAYSAEVPALALRSLALDGASGQMKVAHSQSLDVQGPFTVETWFRITDNDQNQYLVSCLTPTGGYILMANDGMPQLYVTNAAGQSDFAIEWPPVISFGQWQHMAGVFDGSQLRVYLNGQLVAAKNTTIGPGSFAGSLLSVGGYQTGTAAMVQGQVDEVRVSAGALYTTNFTPAARLTVGPATRGLWKFDGGVTQDSSGNGNHGTLHGGASYSTDVP